MKIFFFGVKREFVIETAGLIKAETVLDINFFVFLKLNCLVRIVGQSNEELSSVILVLIHPKISCCSHLEALNIPL